VNLLHSRILFLVLLLGLRLAHADVHFRHFEGDADETKWQESEWVLPDFPKEEALLEFYVSAVTANRFFVDAKSISVGPDLVVRFTLVVKTAGGATNVSFEGLRCDALEHRLYATGRTDGTWAKAPAREWQPIENKPINNYHASLSRNYFCPNRFPVANSDEARDALRRGKHPAAQ